MKRHEQNDFQSEEHLNSPVRIEVVYAGGTISSFATAQGYREGGYKVDLIDSLNEKFPDSIEGVLICGSDFAYLGLSENIDFRYWQEIQAKINESILRSPDAIIVTHGTDSMEQTARQIQFFFGRVLEKKGIIIIITGANNDLFHPKTDAWDNLKFALMSTKRKVPAATYIAFHGQLIPSNLAVKEPFDGNAMNYTSINSERYLALQEMHDTKNNTLIKKIRESASVRADYTGVIDYPVNVVVKDHNALLSSISSSVKVVLLTLYHSGTANTEDSNASVVKLVENLRSRGIVVFGVTENGEPVDLHLYETSVKLRQAGVVPLYDMSKSVAFEKLSYLTNRPATEIITRMLTNVAGEIQQVPIEEDLNMLVRLYS